MHYLLPEGFTPKDLKRRVSGLQLMEKTGLSLPEIQSIVELQAYRDEYLGWNNMLIEGGGEGLHRVEVREIKEFFPESIDDTKICFYRLEDIEKLGGFSFLFSDKDKAFPGHPMGKPIDEDPLFAALKARAALVGGLIEDVPGRTPKTILKDWIQTHYPKISENQISKIVDVVNDGYGKGNGRSLLKKQKK